MWSETGMVDLGSLVVGIEDNKSHDLSNVFGTMLWVLSLPTYLIEVWVRNGFNILESKRETEINSEDVT